MARHEADKDSTHREIDSLMDAIDGLVKLRHAVRDSESFRRGMDVVMKSLDEATPKIAVPKIDEPTRLYDPSKDIHMPITVEGVMRSAEERWNEAVAHFEGTMDRFFQPDNSGEA